MSKEWRILDTANSNQAIFTLVEAKEEGRDPIQYVHVFFLSEGGGIVLRISDLAEAEEVSRETVNLVNEMMAMHLMSITLTPTDPEIWTGGGKKKQGGH